MHAGNVSEALGAATDALAAAGVEGPRFDAELLLAEALGRGRAELAVDPGMGVPPPAARRFGEMVRRRLRREPVAYILGRKGFRRLELAVDRRVLVPRPETEMLVELALQVQPRALLDVGTGSGAIALAVADELPGCAVSATDTSSAALAVARANADRLGLAERVAFFRGTWPSPSSGPAGDRAGEGRPRSFDLILANLPYVATREWPALQPEVRDWEPREALLAGEDGLDAIRSLLACASLRAAASAGGGGIAIGLEVGAGQAAAVAELLVGAGFGRTETRTDLAGIERLVVGRR